MNIKCYFTDRCMYRGKSTMCLSCKNNKLRHKEEDLYEKANDNPIPEKCPRLTFSGPAEQTQGYECPVCGEYTNPYALGKENRCLGCGYKLNVG